MKDYNDYHNYKDYKNWDKRAWREYRHNRHDHNRGWFGFIVLIVGLGILGQQFGWPFISIRHMWPVLIIIIGLIIGIKHRFQNSAPFILIAIGIANLIPPFMIGGVSSDRLLLPGGLILVGLLIIFKPRRKKVIMERNVSVSTSDESQLNIDVTFGGKKSIITSREFKGGNISVAFGGVELNLMQADNPEPIVLDLKVSFGGVEIIVPSHWDVEVDIQPTLGSVEDHRILRTTNAGEERRKLILRGTCAFGSVELKSY